MSNLPPLFDIQRLLPHLNADTLILTPNNRLRSKVLQAWGEYQQQQKQQSWRTPNIHVLDQWLQAQWLTLQSMAYPTTSHVIATADQQRVIWETVTANCGLMQTEAIAKQASQAYLTLLRWNLCDIGTYRSLGINSELVSWIIEFKRRMESLECITQEDSYGIIQHAFDDSSLARIPTIALLGFDDLAPLYEQVLHKASDQLIHLPGPSQQPLSQQRLSFDNSRDEMQACAQWARHILEQDAHARIGIIHPNLGQCREQLERAFSHEFEAHSMLPKTERYTLPFNLSAGTPLGDTPLISSTIKNLNLYKKQYDRDFIESCLLSPFWGKYTAELPSRCALIKRLNAMGTFTVSGDNVRYWAERVDERLAQQNSEEPYEEPHDSTVLALFPYFRDMQALYNSAASKGRQLPSRWVDIFLEHLTLMDWPGERTPDSQEYQQTQLWYQLLEGFAGLDNVLGPILQDQAISQLQYMASHTPFQPKVPDSPIQILGILEGAGLDYTHCWVMGLHQQVWPPAPAPNSLLPVHLQREHNMPHASSLRELAYAQSLTQNYRFCAQHLVVSAPAFEDDGEQVLLPSQLIADLPLSDWQPIQHNMTLEQWTQELNNSASLDIIDTQQAPAYTDTLLPGGSGLLKAQSANPFDSFVKYRLQAQPPIPPVNGFSPLEKGNILHASLAMIWRHLKHQQALLDYAPDALEQLIADSVQLAINDVKKHKPRHLGQTLCEIEQARQQQLIAAWLDYEKQRPPFTVIETETSRDIQFSGKTLSIRIDRVDQLQDGRYLIIDYKTGDSGIRAWENDRPQDPQLPLYALCYPHAVKGISFAQINIQKQSFNGLGDSDIAQGIPAIEKARTSLPKQWDDVLEHWQHVLENLLAEFIQGDCPIQYADNNALRYAEPYLRINRYYEKEAINKLLERNQHNTN